ncbi:meiotically up-regulated gene family-domain-containing protein [Fusarium sp. MPI-SDFR-AT-0072]|nr:meiotically up-regulated gene family-domain-containing protein [Fusarium sp. MPI-SDFR-AT-0072]
MESGTTGLESPTTLTDSPYTSSPRLPLRKQSVTKSDPKSLASEKTSEITNLPITTGSMASSTMTSEDVIVTGTDGTVATYVPEQNKDYISSTGTTTTTDDNGAAIVIFPFGWFWKLHDGKGGGGVAKPPAPTANPVPGNEPSDKNEDNDDNDDDDASTKEDNRSTITTVLPTTQEPTSGTTTTSEETTSEETTSEETTSEETTSEETTSEETTSEESSTDEEATRTYYPCVIHGGPAVETPYCQCSTTGSGEGYYATTTLIDDQCIAYTEFPSQITSAPDTGPITDEPIQQPITATADGTVLVWSAYMLDYINVPGITMITQSVGVGEPSTLSTPLPSQTAVDNDGGGQCGTGDGLSKKGLREACDRAINKFDDDTIYSDYVSRYSRSTKGILVAASVGQAACIAKFQCDDYGIGMKGSDIKEARESAKENDGVDICGHVRLSNSSTIIMDYCTDCKSRGQRTLR